MSYTSTYVLLELSEAAYQEICDKLEKAGYTDLFDDNPDCPECPRIRMQGIAIVPERKG